jgi:hypothetical protein
LNLRNKGTSENETTESYILLAALRGSRFEYLFVIPFSKSGFPIIGQETTLEYTRKRVSRSQIVTIFYFSRKDMNYLNYINNNHNKHKR